MIAVAYNVCRSAAGHGTAWMSIMSVVYPHAGYVELSSAVVSVGCASKAMCHHPAGCAGHYQVTTSGLSNAV
jgi:hypothetical protein